jgi:hypothetical protein
MGKKTRKTRACVAAAAGIALATGAANANFVDGPEGIGDRVWVDADMNGIQDGGEIGLAGVNVNLLNGNNGAIIGSQVTNASGNYMFLFDADALGVWSFNIEFELPVGYSFTDRYIGPDPTVDSDADPFSGLSDLIYISGPGDVRDDVDAGMYRTVVPVPAAVWLFGSGLLGLFGVARRKKIRH